MALTAYAQASDRDHALDAGMTDYLSKPIRAAELAAMIERVVMPDVDAELRGSAPGDRVPDGPALDGSAIEELRAAIGADQFGEIVRQFAIDTERSIEGAIAARAANDGAQLRAAAHRLVGLLGQLGASRAGAAALAVEEANPADLAARAAEMIACGQVALGEIQALAASAASAGTSRLAAMEGRS